MAFITAFVRSPRLELTNTLLAFTLLLTPFTAFAQNGLDQTPTPPNPAESGETYSVIELAPNLHVIQIGARKSNIGLSSGANGALVIDTYLPSFTEALAIIIDQTLNVPVRYVINTHFHGDHTGANPLFRNAGALLIAHQATRITMSGPSWSLIQEQMMPAAPDESLADLTLGDHSALYLDDRVHLVDHQPSAHTAGDLSIFLPTENVLFAGDVVSIERLVLADATNHGSINGLIEAQQRFVDISDDATVIVPGHGDLTTRAELLKSIDFLKQIRDQLVAEKSEGKNFEELDQVAILESAPERGQLEDPKRAEIFLKEAYKSLKTFQ